MDFDFHLNSLNRLTCKDNDKFSVFSFQFSVFLLFQFFFARLQELRVVEMLYYLCIVIRDEPPS